MSVSLLSGDDVAFFGIRRAFGRCRFGRGGLLVLLGGRFAVRFVGCLLVSLSRMIVGRWRFVGGSQFGRGYCWARLFWV